MVEQTIETPLIWNVIALIMTLLQWSANNMANNCDSSVLSYILGMYRGIIIMSALLNIGNVRPSKTVKINNKTEYKVYHYHHHNDNVAGSLYA